MTSRRDFLVMAPLSAFYVAYATAQARPPRIGILSGLPLDKSIAAPVLLDALAELGYRDKAGMILEYRYSTNTVEIPRVAKELVAADCDVLFALISENIVRALRDAGSTPIVFLAFDFDPVDKGIIRSLRRPENNMTGVYVPVADLLAKRLEIAREVLPNAQRFIVLADIHTKDQLAALRKAAAQWHVRLTVVEYMQHPYDLTSAFETARREKVDGLILLTSPVFSAEREKLSALFVKYKMPSFVPPNIVAFPGSLLSYGVHPKKPYRRAAELGVQILKGAKAGEIPVEQADDYELVINVKTARSLGLRIPESVMARATAIVQ